MRRYCRRKRPALSWVGHVGDDFREDAVDVLQRRIGDVARTADQVALGIQIGIVAARTAMAGETNEDQIAGVHRRFRAGFPV